MSSSDQSGFKESAPIKDTASTPEQQPLPPGWARIASKKRPGKFYYFNASTNTSLWEHPARALAQEAKIVANVGGGTTKRTTTKGKAAEKVVQLQNDTQFKKKNLAKQRMEELRTKLDGERKGDSKVVKKTASPKRKPEVKAVSSPKKVEGSVKKQEVPIKKPEVKPVATAKKTEPKPAEPKRKQEVKKVVSPKKPASKKPEVIKTSPPRQKRKLSVDSPKSAKTKPSASPKTSAKSHAIAKKSSPVKPKAKTVQQTIKNEAESLKQFKIPKKPPEVAPSVSSPVLVDIRKLEEVKPEVPIQTPKSIPVEAPVASPKPSSEPPPQYQSTPKVAAGVPQETFTKSPANDRLAQLRNQIAQNVEFDEDAEMTDLSLDTSTAVEVEEMEWEDIPEEIALQEVVTVRRSLGLKLASADSSLNSSIPEHQFDQVTSSFQRFFFVVVDTNIFLSHLKPLEQLLTTGIPTVGQPILIIPYIVLQELDRIKHREAGRPLSQAACRSIRFLNDLLKRRDPRIKGQSTIEAAAPIIPIENPDDHIVNCCCQQVGQLGQCTELFLLSNDVNLRNKALVSGLTAVGFGELMAEAERLRKVAAAAAASG